MSKIQDKLQTRILRKNKVSKTIKNSSNRTRLSVNFSNKHVTAQLIDDASGKTLAAVSSSPKKKATLTEKAMIAGEDIAKKAKTAKVVQVKLDRRGKKYHGNVKAFAESARKAGLEF